MKTKTFAKVQAATHLESHPVHVQRFQIFRQSRAGNFMAELETDSPTEAVEMFAIISPAFDGGEIRIWDNSAQKICAAVNWHLETTPFGFVVRHRQNVFHDPMLAIVARELSEREALRDSILSGIDQNAWSHA